MFPGEDGGGVLLEPGEPVIEFGALRIGQRSRIGFQAFPDCVQQFRLLSDGEVAYLL